MKKVTNKEFKAQEKLEALLAQLCRSSKLQAVSGLIGRCRSQRVAHHLIDDAGSLHNVEEVKELLVHELFVPGGIQDALIMRHMREVVDQLDGLWPRLRRLGLPLCHERAQALVRAAAGLPPDAELTDADVKRALLGALLCPLRQSVGSCFATAPAILVHREAPEKCLEDLIALLTKGELSRTFGGVTFSVPFCPSPGIGDLKRPLQDGALSSPGILQALVASGLIEKELNLNEQLDRQRRLVFPLLSKVKTPLELIRTLLLDHFSLSEEAVRMGAKYESQAVQREMVAADGLHLVGSFREALENAKLAFISFADNPLLKAWEFTIASLCDVKTEFSSWNLFSSLGLHPEEKGGIGALIYEHLEERLQEDNEKIEQYQRDYAIAFDQVRATELLLGRAAGEDEVRRLRIEHQSRLHHMYTCLDLRDKHQEEAKQWSDFFSFLLDQYSSQFPHFFQEVYDPEMQELRGTEYDDSPAGFRLLYKHGRAHVGSWTFVRDAEEWVQSLIDFFTRTEVEILTACEWESGKRALGLITTGIIHLVRTEDFLRSAFFRLAKAHNVPLKTVSIESLEKLEKKPWAYTSGGNMQTLLKTYFKREGTISEEARSIDSPLDLCTFFLDTLKILPPRVTDPFEEDPEKRMLATSPTHAFSFLPGKCFQRPGWSTRRFTYTWVRDEIFTPSKDFYEAMSFTSSEQRVLASILNDAFSPSDSILSIEQLSERIPLDPTLVAAFLFEMLPLTPRLLAEKAAHRLGAAVPSFPEIVTRRELIETITQTLSHQCGGTPKEDLYEKVVSELEEMHLSPPAPFIIADTNWQDYFFAFVTNPVTLEFDFWRTDRLGIRGHPMSEWRHFFDGSAQEKWGLYLRPHEYS